MLTKINSKNQITLPKSLIKAVGPTDYFDIEVRAGHLVLTPVRFVAADAVRVKLAKHQITQADVVAAVDWARAQTPTN